MALASAADSPILPLASKLLFVGDVLKPAFPVLDVSALLCKLLLLLPDAALVIECRLRSLELALCRSCSFGSTLRLLCALSFLARPGYAYAFVGPLSAACGLQCFHTNSTASSRAAANIFPSRARSRSSIATRIAWASSCSAWRCSLSRYCMLGVRVRDVREEDREVSRPRGGCTSGLPTRVTTSSMLFELVRVCDLVSCEVEGRASASTAGSVKVRCSDDTFCESLMRLFDWLDHVLKCAGAGRAPVGRAGRFARKS
jgi:hypothetical protein